MGIALLFWLIYIIALLLSLLGGWQTAPVGNGRYYVVGGSLLFFVLVGLLGWHVFGPAVHG
jgi:hypothetical protein